MPSGAVEVRASVVFLLLIQEGLDFFRLLACLLAILGRLFNQPNKIVTIQRPRDDAASAEMG